MREIFKKPKVLIGIIIFLMSLSILFWADNLKIGKSTIQPEIERLEEEKVILIIDNGSSNIQQFELELKGEATVFDLLSQAGLDLNYTEYDVGIFVDAIEGIKNNGEEKMNWMYYINGETAKVGARECIVKPNDKIEWRYEKVEW